MRIVEESDLEGRNAGTDRQVAEVLEAGARPHRVTAGPVEVYLEHLVEATKGRRYGGLIKTGPVAALRTLVETLPSLSRSKSPRPRLPTDTRVGPPRSSAAFSSTEAGSPLSSRNLGR